MVTWENYEEYMMMHTDGELSPDEELALMSFVEQHPELKKELSAYSLTHSLPDVTQVYANKDELLKPLPAKRIIVFHIWGRYSIAAGVAAILCISLFRYLPVSNTKEIVMTGTVIKGKQTVSVTAASAVVKNDVKIQNDPADTFTTVSPVINVPHKESLIAVTGKKNKPQNQQEQIMLQPLLAKEAIAIKELPIVAIEQLPQVDNKIVSVVKDIPAYTLAHTEENEEHKRSFWDKLPINDPSKQNIESIASSVADAYGEVNDIKHNIENTKLVVRVEKRKLIISF